MNATADIDRAFLDLATLNAEAAAEREVAAGVPGPGRIECWMCQRRLSRCSRPDCERVWRLRPGPTLAAGGK